MADPSLMLTQFILTGCLYHPDPLPFDLHSELSVGTFDPYCPVLVEQIPVGGFALDLYDHSSRVWKNVLDENDACT